ncbi:MAG: 2-oxo acid dehydrogenase subunit E2 [Candidatus Thorarchaeota archaeon]|nr:2-oxo acid dehydrogenase subunit E2 [Candidatus Thorarchaeota archaeon]
MSETQDSDQTTKGESSNSFREVTHRFTLPIELLNNLAPKHRIYGLIEVDVTKARIFISEVEKRTGEKMSFTAWVIRCIGQAVSEHIEVQALRKGKKKLIIFNDVDVGMIVEKQTKVGKIPTQYCVRRANEKSFRQIHDEIRHAQKADSGDSIVTGKRKSSSGSRLRSLPGPLRRLFWRKFRSDPFLRKKLMGTVGVTAIGMFGKGGGYAIPVGMHPAVFALGGISKKLRDPMNPSDIGEFLNLTVMFDEEISYGAPATRFVARLLELMQTGFGLE